MPKPTLFELSEARKTGRQFTEIRTSDVREARACAEAGVEMIMCMKEDLPALRSAVSDVFLVAANPWTNRISPARTRRSPRGLS